MRYWVLKNHITFSEKRFKSGKRKTFKINLKQPKGKNR